MDIVLKYFPTYFLFTMGMASCQGISTNSPAQPSGENSVNSAQFLSLVNEVRAKGVKCGSTFWPKTHALVLDKTLSKVAYQHSLYMESKRTLSHKGKNGSNAGDRVSAAGYPYQFLAENIAVGPGTDAGVFDLWLNSTGHCENIMEPKAKKLGYGRSGKYWTMLVATP